MKKLIAIYLLVTTLLVQPISAVSGEYETTTDKQSFCVALNGESAYALRRNA